MEITKGELRLAVTVLCIELFEQNPEYNYTPLITASGIQRYPWDTLILKTLDSVKKNYNNARPHENAQTHEEQKQ